MTYIQSETLLIADIYEMFRDSCLKTFILNYRAFLFDNRISSDWSLKKTKKVNLELLTDQRSQRKNISCT